MSWLSNYRASLVNGRSARVVRLADNCMAAFALAWVVVLCVFSKTLGTYFDVYSYLLLLPFSIVFWAVVKVFFTPERQAR